MFKEILPNMIPYLAAGAVYSITGAILAEVSIEVIGITPGNLLSLGMMLFNVQQFGAAGKGWWHWIIPPVMALIVIFTSLYLVALGLDEIGNPRLKTR